MPKMTIERHITSPAVPFSKLRMGDLFRFKDGMGVYMRTDASIESNHPTHVSLSTGEALFMRSKPDTLVEPPTEATLMITFAS